LRPQGDSNAPEGGPKPRENEENSGACTIRVPPEGGAGPDAALRAAVKAALDAGLYERARALLDVLAKTSEVGTVVPFERRDKGR
jgi:hypothetical protein